MYKQNLYVKNVKGKESVFSKVIIPARKPILYLTGNIYNKSSIKNTEDVIQIGPKKYLGFSGSIDDKIRHSCSPTSYLNMIGDKAILYSIFEIKPHIEITYDFSLSLLDPDLEVNCSCESIHCRKKITVFNSLPENIKNKYNKLKLIPIHIKYDIFKQD